MTDTDAALLEAARLGDRGAFEELVRRTYTETYTLAVRLTGNEEDARDVVQEAYLRAWRGLPKFRGESQFSTWLYRITVNTAYSHVNRRRRHRAVPLSDLGTEIADQGASPEASAESAALSSRLTAAVGKLPPKLRAVMVLKDVYGLPHEAIAAELGISETAAKVRLHRARKKLREDLFPRRVEEAADAV